MQLEILRSFGSIKGAYAEIRRSKTKFKFHKIIFKNPNFQGLNKRRVNHTLIKRINDMLFGPYFFFFFDQKAYQDVTFK